MKETFEEWFAINRASKAFMDEYMKYFYDWTGWKVKTNDDPLSYRAWMRTKYNVLAGFPWRNN